MKVQVIWDNGDETIIADAVETEPFIQHIKDGTIFNSIQNFKTKNIVINFTRARYVRLLYED